MARRRTARREIAGRAGGHEAAQDRTRRQVHPLLARGFDAQAQRPRDQLLGAVVPLDPHGPQHGPPAAEEPADDLGDAQDHQSAGAPDQRRAEQAQTGRGRGVPRHVPLRAGILHPAGAARPHAARQRSAPSVSPEAESSEPSPERGVSDSGATPSSTAKSRRAISATRRSTTSSRRDGPTYSTY